MKILNHNLDMQTGHQLLQGQSVTTESFEKYLEIERSENFAKESTDQLEEMKYEALDKIFHLSGSDLSSLESSSIVNDINSLQSASKVSESILKDFLSPNDGSEQFKKFLLEKGERFTHSYYEKESYTFATQGSIQTDSGSFNIDVGVSMSRSFMMTHSIETSKFFDPLVINLDGAVGSLNEQTFKFDLDNDGKKDQISTLGEGSGFLALDRNSNGKIDQGSELFGTLGGNGFSELAKYDQDNNNWIDESDDIFDKLRIWFKNSEESEGELIGLGEKGIGAIYLQPQSGQYTYKTDQNQSLGELKSSSIFLNENGTVGHIAQIDFALQNQIDKKGDVTFKSPLQDLLQAV
jgi:hypothetical protein